ncbi:MAG: superoxide dismutase [Sphaerochaeta sp.]|jgi:Fe-Mn family superoxide dismutase|nr:MAG: superoxide dismutase [Sphaerochaeta sp.]HOE89986.1 superoxide dismutase [Sphaerochaeta sp.]
MFVKYTLPYSYDAMEPHIDALTMETHYTKHHEGYTNNLNDAVAKAQVDKDIASLLGSLDEIADPALRRTIRNNGGGYYNHNLYFATISPDGGKDPSGAFGNLLKSEFGSIDELKAKLSAFALGQFGSGWAWLSANKDGKLLLSSTPNQDNPLMDGKGYTPILGIDVWEHAYYLKYKNLRGEYVKAFFNVVDWDEVAGNYEKIRK